MSVKADRHVLKAQKRFDAVAAAVRNACRGLSVIAAGTSPSVRGMSRRRHVGRVRLDRIFEKLHARTSMRHEVGIAGQTVATNGDVAAAALHDRDDVLHGREDTNCALRKPRRPCS